MEENLEKARLVLVRRTEDGELFTGSEQNSQIMNEYIGEYVWLTDGTVAIKCMSMMTMSSINFSSY